MPSAALGAKSVAMPARKSCVRTTRTRTMSRMTRTSPMKIRRSALIGTTIASFNRGTVLVLELDDEPDRARASGHAGTDLGPACASVDVGRARVQVRVVDQDDHAAARAAAAAGVRSAGGERPSPPPPPPPRRVRGPGPPPPPPPPAPPGRGAPAAPRRGGFC